MDRRSYLALGTALLAGCSSSGGEEEAENTQSTDQPTQTPTDTPTQTATQTTTTQESTPQSASASIGEVIEDDTLQMVVREISRTESISEFQEAGEGNEFVVVRMAVKNITEDFDIPISSFLQTRIKDTENYTYQPTIGGTAKAFQGGILAPGEVSRGDLYFEVPSDASGLTMQFDFSGTSVFEYNRAIVDLSSQADSIADLSQSLNVDIHSVGEAVEYEGLQVTVNSVSYETSLGQFTEAEDGNEFAIVDISTANNTDEEISVSSLLQMKSKDGRGFSHQVSISAMSQLDRSYPQGSPLGAGETRRGKVPYEVPADTDELYWTFGFSSFVDGFKEFWTLK